MFPLILAVSPFNKPNTSVEALLIWMGFSSDRPETRPYALCSLLISPLLDPPSGTVPTAMLFDLTRRTEVSGLMGSTGTFQQGGANP